jgi:beta-glucosidase
MKKPLKITLITLASLILLVAIVGLFGWMWVKSSFLNFEKDFAENKDFQEITVDGHKFFDRNGNGQLDIYEDDRKTAEERATDLLSQMTLEEKIHILKGSGMASGMGRVPTGEGIPGAIGTIVPTPRLGIPTVYLSDGPAGLRIEPTRKDDNHTYLLHRFSDWHLALFYLECRS